MNLLSIILDCIRQLSTIIEKNQLTNKCTRYIGNPKNWSNNTVYNAILYYYLLLHIDIYAISNNWHQANTRTYIIKGDDRHVNSHFFINNKCNQILIFFLTLKKETSLRNELLEKYTFFLHLTSMLSIRWI